MQQVYDTLARRAYELFESRGRQDGQDLEDWFRAESELLNAMPVEITEADDQVIVRAEVPGLSDKDIEVRVAPQLPSFNRAFFRGSQTTRWLT
jgi:HSP20 family molecular chaperone IbpA